MCLSTQERLPRHKRPSCTKICDCSPLCISVSPKQVKEQSLFEYLQRFRGVPTPPPPATVMA